MPTLEAGPGAFFPRISPFHSSARPTQLKQALTDIWKLSTLPTLYKIWMETHRDFGTIIRKYFKAEYNYDCPYLEIYRKS
jgi:hypothetical protein